MKIRLTILIIFVQFVTHSSILPQKWLNVLESSGQTVSIDTSNLKLVDNKISVLFRTHYKEPQKFSTFNEKVSIVKTQVLFNAESQKYTVIGNLYYDQKSKILGESNVPLYAISSTNFSVPINKNPLMALIYNKCLSSLKSSLPRINLNTDSLNIIAEKYLSSDSTLFVTRRDTLTSSVKDTAEVASTKEELLQNTISENKDKFNKINTLDTSNDAVNKFNNQEILAKDKYQTDSVIVPTYTAAQPIQENYDSKNESNIEGNIFTDGRLYCFQVSSWRNLRKAEQEVSKLKKEGHNAFVEEAEIPHRGKWYRVRIGFFHSLNDVQLYIKSMKK
ncbi:SPOR domain-containing protein [Melioribacteraceae bacterium 4301-Me]|uniref:SPOR domain-containing protein n=1 Tax=Pyranulibacter aquaticus TaxID=3163344 RepID=UPI00359A0D35